MIKIFTHKNQRELSTVIPLILFILFLVPPSIQAQFTDRVWCFGDSAGINFSDVSNPTTFGSNLRTRGSCVSISDANSRLLFYAFTRAGVLGETTLVIDSSHSLMQNGNNIVGQGWYNELVILPQPNNSTLFYIVSNGITNSGLSGLYYSKIDMSQNGGYGSVVQKNVLLNTDSLSDAMIGIKHGNGRDWWMIVRSWHGNNLFYIYLIDPNGISLYNAHPHIVSFSGSLGDFAYSYESSKFLFVTQFGQVQILNFDRCTGMFSNSVIIESPNINSKIYFGCSLSPNGNVAYVSNTNNIFGDSLTLYQYDLTATNIFQSRQTIYKQPIPASGGLHALGPDGKIYISCLYEFGYPYADSIHNVYSDNISVINYPDSLGLACDFQPFSFNLGGRRAYWGLPNNPNYEAGAWVGSPCDTLTGTAEITTQPPGLNVFYHHGFETLFINAQGLSGKHYTMTIYDITGRLVSRESGKLTSSYYTRDLYFGNPPGGIYLVSLITEKEQLSVKVLKQ